jgi:hypothetical protein
MALSGSIRTVRLEGVLTLRTSLPMPKWDQSG